MIRRIVVTGMGMISPLGNLQQTWEGLVAGGCGIRSFDTTAHENITVSIAGLVNAPLIIPGQNPTLDYAHRIRHKTDRITTLAFHALSDLLKSCAVDPKLFRGERAGIVFGPAFIGLGSLQKKYDLFQQGKRTKDQATTVVKSMADGPAAWLAMYLGSQGPNLCSVSACATSLTNTIAAIQQIELGLADTMLTGGVETTTAFFINGFHAAGTLSKNSDPAKASRPFDCSRDGFVFSEGAAVMLFESLESASQRGAAIFAEVIGYAQTCDASDIMEPSTPLQIRAIELALINAGISANDVDIVNAHATSTKNGDLSEAKAIAQVYCNKPLITAFKGNLGHMMGASGTAETIMLIETMQKGIASAIANLDSPDPDCHPGELRFARETSHGDFEIGVKHSFGFGGRNAVIILKRYEP